MGLNGIFILKALPTALCICRHICIQKTCNRLSNYLLMLLENEERSKKKKHGQVVIFNRS